LQSKKRAREYASNAASASIFDVTKKSAKKPKRPVFDAIRKPTAPSSQKIGADRPEERAHPALRKVKHKNKRDPRSNDDVQ
jgi:hypothetical protein